MLSSAQYIQLSMEHNLFWVRIMKEHTIFIESAMPPALFHLAQQAEQFRQRFSVLLAETIRLSTGFVSRSALQSGQYYTKFTEASEQAVQNLTGISTDSYLTQMEYDISPLTATPLTNEFEKSVYNLNGYILSLTQALAGFKSDLLNNINSCKITTSLYPADVNHMLHEALKYVEVMTALQSKDERLHQNYREFWNINMAEHAKSMRGLFDPTETAFFRESDRYALVFDALAALPDSASALNDTRELGAFKATVTQGMLACKVRSIMNPLYTDHNLREASHYIYLMES